MSRSNHGRPVNRVRLRLDTLEARDVPTVVGGLDPSFGTNGVTAVVPGHSFKGVAAQQDGKLVAVSNAGPDFYITRYNPDGTIDTSFGNAGTGVVTVDIGGAGKTDNARAVAI
ncbi:MAG TPA: delta-60 repeat domain-containing protein, partial [Gemmataceae bacterium]|nr:delta-60 repeat domain-containing protein [Gemmataceae bacterium]